MGRQTVRVGNDRGAVYLLSENRRAEEVVGKLNPSELERVIHVIGQQPDRLSRGTLAALQDSRPTPPPAWISVLWRSSDARARILVLVGSAKPAADHLGPVKPAALGRGIEYRRHRACPPTQRPRLRPCFRWCLAHRFGLHLADRKVRQSHSIPLARQ
jgi:hypothetical protein